MSEKKKGKSAKQTPTATTKQELVEITLPDNPTEADIRKATKYVIDNTEFHPVNGCNDLMCQVDVRVLHIDRTYQRNMNKIAIKPGTFDKSKCDALWASYRDGLVNVINGQHRLYAALTDHVQYLPIRLINGLTGLTLEEEAERFYRQNEGEVPMSTQDSHKTALIFGEAAHTILQKYCDYYSLVLGNKGIRHGYYFNCLKQAITALNRLMGKGGEKAMGDFLKWFFGIYEDAGWLSTDSIGTACTSLFFNAMASLYEHEYNRVTSEYYNEATHTPPKFETYRSNLTRAFRLFTPENLETYAKQLMLKQNSLNRNGDTRTWMKSTITQLANDEITGNMILYLQFKLN